MKIKAIKTRVINPPQDNIYDILDKLGEDLKEKDIIFITSKILAIHQGKCQEIKELDNIEEKDELVKKEAELFIPRQSYVEHSVNLTIKYNTLIPNAGIDESNSNGYYVLWPENPEKEAEKICKYLKDKFNIKDLAVLITDSHTTPLRYGVIGISMGFYGMKPFKSYIGTEDIFGRELQMSRVNIVDSLSVSAVLAMGEGAEQTPIAIISDCEYAEFTNKPAYNELNIPLEEDIYYPLIKQFHNDK
ncbi:MAG: coenzyme F420-0:L-glutamate ligase [Candidatus Gracilibacteria bacterium]|nr:coenzyme F420-0:L-glutamate ligase [Candidatus Gracilibacteria bacterium]